MSSIGRLYGATGNTRVNKSLLIAKLSGVDIDFDPSFKFGVDNKSEKYLKKFPMGQTPAFEGKDGLLLTESANIPLYIASHKPNNPLLGSNNNEYHQILQYVFFGETSIVPLFLSILLPILGYAPYDEKAEAKAYENLKRPLNYLNDILKDKTYLVGDKLTFADINTYFALESLFVKVYGKQDLDQFPHLFKYFKHLGTLPEFKEITGGIAFREERAKFQPKV